MSDITGGPPLPKSLPSVSHGTDKATSVARDRQHANEQTREDTGKENKTQQQNDTANVRDPAVSISASTAQLRVGEELTEKVTKVDQEGRPIIETEKATFALRPDAGLKAGDDVTLVVREAQKNLVADLLKHNGVVIDPPIRLNLIVIAVHIHEPLAPNKNEKAGPPLATPYRPSQPSPVITTVKADTEAETLARLLGRNPMPAASNSVTLDKSLPTAPLVAGSANLSQLISAQQTPAKIPPIVPPTIHQTQIAGLSNQQATPNHILPSSPLTDVAMPAIGIAAGLGPLIPAITIGGETKALQLLDPSISKVTPSQVASVISVRPLTTTDAKMLPISVAALGNMHALAHVETNKGIFVLAQNEANSLAGELVKISSVATPLNPTADANLAQRSSTLTSYNARLQGSGTGEPRSIVIQFPPQETGTPPIQANLQATANQQNTTTVTAVHTIRAYLTPDGPKSDIRIETPLGDISLSLANVARPLPGDTVSILPASQLESAVMQATATAAAVAGTAITSTSWPTFEQTYSQLQAFGAVGAEALQSLTARTAQGGAKFSNSAMFLMSAMGGGKASSWIGKTTEKILAQRNSQLLSALKEDIGKMFNMAAEGSGEWRALLLPLDARSNDMPMLAFLFGQGSAVDPDAQRSDKQEADDDEDEIKRFILEVQFSVLGTIQLDGTIRGQRFDLMVRSEKQFPPKLTQDTSELFSNALIAGAFTGSLGFSVEEQFPVDVGAIISEMPANQKQNSL